MHTFSIVFSLSHYGSLLTFGVFGGVFLNFTLPYIFDICRLLAHFLNSVFGVIAIIFKILFLFSFLSFFTRSAIVILLPFSYFCLVLLFTFSALVFNFPILHKMSICNIPESGFSCPFF